MGARGVPWTGSPHLSPIATLVSNPARPAVTDAVVTQARRLLPGSGPVRVLDPGIAVDIPFAAGGQSLPEIAQRLREAIEGPVDVVVQDGAARRRRLFLADMDSTMIEQECIDELADFVGLKAEVAGITERAMRGEIAFEPALRERVALLKGLPVGVVDRIIAERLTLTPGGPALVATMRANGAYACLVSGGFTLFTGPVSARLGFDEHRANRLVVEGETLGGAVDEPIMGREAKLATLTAEAAKHGLPLAETLAVGDGANDIPMITSAGLGIGYHPHPAAAAAADAAIRHHDLTALLWAQGYPRRSWVLG